MLTQAQAHILCEAYEVYALLESDEEVEFLESEDPDMLEAYCALHRIAVGVDSVTHGGNAKEREVRSANQP